MRSDLIGAYGEHLAAKYLREEHYDIKAANFKTYTGEIDLIAEKNGVLCFIEVKTRQIGGMTSPADAVNVHKQENIKSAAAVYLNRWAKTDKYRFDIIEVFLDGKEVQKINHLSDVF